MSAPLEAPARGRGPRPELWEEQARNRRATILLIAGFVALLGALGFGADLFIGMGMERGYFPVLGPIALAVGCVQSIVGFYAGDRAVLLSARARPADPANAKEAVLLNVVQEMRLASGLPMPRVYVLPDDDPNAFAVGRDPKHAAVAVTRGLLDRLDREELQGVIAHEMGHVRNLDIRTMTLVAALLGAVVLVSDFAGRSLRFGGGRRRSGKDGGGALLLVALVIWLALVFFAPILGQMMAFAVSRSREYDADASAAEFTRNPRGLASALRKIDEIAGPTTTIGRGSAHLCIADPRGRTVNRREGAVASLFATHPPIASRVAKLEAMAGGPG